MKLDNCAKTLLTIKCACILYNLNPHHGINFIIPNEVFFNKKTDTFKLKVCEYIFIEYLSDSPSYCVLKITSKSIIINKINLEDNIDLMDKFNNENIKNEDYNNEYQEEILKNSNIEESINMTSNESHAKILHENNVLKLKTTILENESEDNISDLKIDSYENERRKRNRVNNINMLISKNYEEAMNSENNKEITKIISKDKNINTKVSTDKTANIIIGINIIKANKGYKINQKDYIGKMLNSNINNTKITRTSYINVKLEIDWISIICINKKQDQIQHLQYV
ncbi:hypothetical protein H8356DRAFT_1323563 [Neocallimastix lanati (nom. inval.)]|nr:hypothetical protein H8356DRAFT_1323563 [Neocallimastix sp. JGI-2020a]